VVRGGEGVGECLKTVHGRKDDAVIGGPDVFVIAVGALAKLPGRRRKTAETVHSVYRPFVTRKYRAASLRNFVVRPSDERARTSSAVEYAGKIFTKSRSSLSLKTRPRSFGKLSGR